MATEIVIAGELVRTQDVQIISEARLEDWIAKLEHRPPVNIGFLPKTQRLIRWDESNPKRKIARFLCELPPAMRYMLYQPRGQTRARRYGLSTPWTYFLFDFHTTADPMAPGALWEMTGKRVFWAKEEATSLNSLIYRAMVPNCDIEGTICYGSTGVDVTLPLGTRIDRLVDEFYRTIFVHDSGAGSPWISETRSVSWLRWETESKKDPAAWERFPEWNGNYLHPQKLSDLWSANYERPTIVNVIDRIPDIAMPATMGYYEEWLNRLGTGPEARQFRSNLKIALENYAAERPEEVPATAAGARAAAEEVGGELV